MSVVQLLHLTDTHLFSDTSLQLKGINTHDSFVAVVNHAFANIPNPDAIILGGDMAQDEAPETYQLLANMLCNWSAPWMLSPGNHANITALETTLIPALEHISSYSRCIQFEDWQVITLNTHHTGQISGLLVEAELQRLDRLLSAEPHKHALIALHHHPAAIESAWLDRIDLHDKQALWHIIQQHHHVRGLLCGHIHQALDIIHKGIRILGTPSCSVQFKPRQQNFSLDDKPPGYRILNLMPNGQMKTLVKRIDGFIPVDLNNNEPY